MKVTIYNLCFDGEAAKIILQVSLNILNCSSEQAEEEIRCIFDEN